MLVNNTCIAAVAAAGLWAFSLGSTAAPPVQAADRILINGELLTMVAAKPRASALAIRGGQIVAVGTDADVKKWRGPHTKVVDLGGRTVVPGIVDTHIHAIRGGQDFSFETGWRDQTTLAGAIERLRQDARQRRAGSWAGVAGGWHPDQFVERRPPTVKELSEAIPDSPIYVQYFYEYALLNNKGIELLGLNEGAALPPGIVVERDTLGKATGKLFGGVNPFNALLARISVSTPEQNRESLAAYFTSLNRLGVTGVVDPSAGNFAAYSPLFSLWKDKALTLRVGYRASVLVSDGEFAWFNTALTFLPPFFGDDMLRFFGLGEVVVMGMNDGVRLTPGFSPSQKSKDELFKVAMLAAERGYQLEIHAYTDDSAKAIIEVFESVAQQRPIRHLRWMIAHISTGSEDTFERMRKLGVGYTVQMTPYFWATALREIYGDAVAVAAPPTRLAMSKGLMVAGGTDLTRGGMSVWHAIEYHITGRSVGGGVQRRDDQLLNRDEALRLYTTNAAWLTFDEERKGTLEPGKFADLAVLDAPYLRVPATQIHRLRSVMTVVGGNVVHSDQDALRRPGSSASSSITNDAVLEAVWLREQQEGTGHRH